MADCTKSDFVNPGGMGTQVYDVTSTMNRNGYSGTWKLTVNYGSVVGLSNTQSSSQPAPATDSTQIYHWKNGRMGSRAYCSRNGYYYWVFYAATLTQTGSGSSGGGGSGSDGGGTNQPTTPPTGNGTNCPLSTFKFSYTGKYYASSSAAVAELDRQTGLQYTLFVYYNTPLSCSYYGTSEPPARSLANQVNDFKSGYMWGRVSVDSNCRSSSSTVGKYFYWVKYKASLVAGSASAGINPKNCPLSSFNFGWAETYYEHQSDAVKYINDSGTKKYKLIVYYNTPLSCSYYGTTQPPARSLANQVNDFKSGYMWGRVSVDENCKSTTSTGKYFYWVKYKAELVVIESGATYEEYKGTLVLTLKEKQSGGFQKLSSSLSYIISQVKNGIGGWEITGYRLSGNKLELDLRKTGSWSLEAVVEFIKKILLYAVGPWVILIQAIMKWYGGQNETIEIPEGPDCTKAGDCGTGYDCIAGHCVEQNADGDGNGGNENDNNDDTVQCSETKPCTEAGMICINGKCVPQDNAGGIDMPEGDIEKGAGLNPGDTPNGDKPGEDIGIGDIIDDITNGDWDELPEDIVSWTKSHWYYPVAAIGAVIVLWYIKKRKG